MIHHVELLTRNNNYHGTEPDVAGSYQGSYGDDADDSGSQGYDDGHNSDDDDGGEGGGSTWTIGTK